jgi:hypothetical protein
MLREEFKYGGVLAWGCRGDLTLDDVVHWNQERLDRDFELGYTEDVSNNYRQLLLRHPQYSECRVIIHSGSRLISVIVPEDDIFEIGGPFPVELSAEDTDVLEWHTRPEQVEPLRQLAMALWRSGLVVSVQTHGELGAAIAYASLREGRPPSMVPFAIVDAGWIGSAQLAAQGIHDLPVANNGILVERVRRKAEPAAPPDPAGTKRYGRC